MKLFMFVIGGDCRNSNVELHDVRFAVGRNVEDCYPELRRQWWGEPQSLHLDAWMEVTQADGYDIALSDMPAPDNDAKLFFINLGGYDPTQFGELHKNLLLVASNRDMAKARALTRVTEWQTPHKDAIFELDKALDLSEDLARHGVHLHFRPASREKEQKFVCRYVPLGDAVG
jgi:hypothetical protein